MLKEILLFHYSIVIICVLMWWFTDEVKDSIRTEHMCVVLRCIEIKSEVSIGKKQHPVVVSADWSRQYIFQRLLWPFWDKLVMLNSEPVQLIELKKWPVW